MLPTESKFMLDVQARIAHMDELGTDLQVLYPSMWTGPITNNPAEEVALCRSYNRWMADIYAEGKGRFKWAAVMPVLDLEEAERQLRFAKDNGAVAINLRGIEVGNRLINDPYFYPVYEWAAELDMPICPHSGTGSFELDAIFGSPTTQFERNKFSGLSAFHTLIMSGLPDRFPNTKWGIIEFSADWLPYMLNDLARRMERRGDGLTADPLTENNIWVTVQLNDDLEQIHNYVGGTGSSSARTTATRTPRPRSTRSPRSRTTPACPWRAAPASSGTTHGSSMASRTERGLPTRQMRGAPTGAPSLVVSFSRY